MDTSSVDKGVESLSVFEAAFEQLPYAALVVDDDACCLQANAAARRRLRADSETLEGEHLNALLQTGDESTFETIWAECLAGDGSDAAVRAAAGDDALQFRCDVRPHISPGRHLVTLVADDVAAPSELELRERRQRALGELGRLALKEASLESICQRAVDVIGPHLGLDTCVFYPPVEGRDQIMPAAVWTRSDDSPIPVDVTSEEAWPIRHATQESGEPLVVPDVDQMQEGTLRDVLERAGARTAILVGVGTPDERFGMVVGASGRLVSIGRSRREFLRDVSQVLGQAISARVSMNRLRESRERLQVATRLGRLSQFQWDVEAGRIDFDRQMARNLGFAADEMPTSIDDTLEWVYEDDQDEVRQRVETVLRGDEDEYELYARVVGAEREWRWQLSRGRAVEWDEDGRATRIVGFQQDVHERVESEMSRAELEEKLRQSKKMEALGRLAGGIAHDFNNLLTAITGYAELVYHQIDDPELRDDVREISVASARAERLTSRLLSLTRRQSVRSAVVDLNAMIREYEEMLRRLIGGDIEVDVDLADSVWPVEIDRGALEQIVLNLVVNARDAMPDGGQLLISTDRYELAPKHAATFPDLTVGDYVRLTVEDSGVGMDEQTRERALEPFFTTKDVGEGTGLGLATVYGAVRQAGGSVTIDSEPGEGTRIEILLPRSHRELSEFESVEPRDIDVDAAGETILVAEDDPVLLNLVQRVLADRNFEVVAFEDAREALAWLDDPETSLDLLLTDVVMPGAKGTELAERAQERFPGMNILFMSGYTADAEFSAWKETEGVELIRKPFTPASLVERVLDLLANHR